MNQVPEFTYTRSKVHSITVDSMGACIYRVTGHLAAGTAIIVFPVTRTILPSAPLAQGLKRLVWHPGEALNNQCHTQKSLPQSRIRDVTENSERELAQYKCFKLFYFVELTMSLKEFITPTISKKTHIFQLKTPSLDTLNYDFIEVKTLYVIETSVR